MDISVDRIAERAEISRGTFFNYFPQKEDILLYAFEIWRFHEAVEQKLNPKMGAKAIEHLFNKAAESFKKRPGFATSTVAFITNTNMGRGPRKFDISYAERVLLYPDLDGLEYIKILPLHEMLFLHVQEAIRDKELKTEFFAEVIANLLETLWYGGFLTAHMHGTDISHIYKSSLSWVFGTSVTEVNQLNLETVYGVH